MCLGVWICLILYVVHPSVCLSACVRGSGVCYYLSMCLSVFRSVCLSDCLHAWLYIYRTVCVEVSVCACLSVCLTVQVLISESAVCLCLILVFVCLQPCACLSSCVCLSICPSACRACVSEPGGSMIVSKCDCVDSAHVRVYA